MSSSLKPSKYIVESISSDEKYILLFNTRTGALAQIPHVFRPQLLEYLSQQQGQEIIEKTRLFRMLLQGGFLIDSTINELDEIRHSYSKTVGRQILHISIMPTLACNMACQYCFEQHQNISMDQKAADSIINFVKGRLPKVKRFVLNWYGGEPLLKADFIIQLQKRITDLCQQYDVDSTLFMMTTNGYLLTPEICDSLVSEGVQSFQVTIDGPRRIHDARRFLNDGRPSFDKIVSNLSYAIRIADVEVRVNVDFDNIIYLEEMLDDLVSLGLQEVKSLSFKAIVPPGGRNEETQRNTFSIPEFTNAIYYYSEKARQMGFNVYAGPAESRGIYEFCPVDLQDQWIIGPDLHLFKCADAFGVKESVGYLAEDGTLHLNGSINMWRNKAIFNDPACCECVFLPQCMGGCSLKKLVHGMDWCPEERFDIKSYVKTIYDIFNSKSKLIDTDMTT